MSDQLTIREARDLMRPNLKKGIECPCCMQRAQMYVRSLTWSMLYGLILLYRASLENEDEWTHLEKFFKKSQFCPTAVRGDVPKMRFWGFIEAKDEVKEDGNPNSGYYRITAAGINFILGHSRVQKSVKIYNNKFYGFEGNEIDVHVAIKGKFNYDLLMKGGVG